MKRALGKLFWLCLLSILFGVNASPTLAQLQEPVKHTKPKHALHSMSIFKDNFDTRGILGVKSVVKVEDTQAQVAKQAEGATTQPVTGPAATPAADTTASRPEARALLTYVSDDPSANPILPPDSNPHVRINPDAPGSIKGMIAAKRSNDPEMARAYAKQFVRYQQNFFFELREIVQLIGEAMVDEGVIDEDQWVGVGQMMEYEFAQTRHETGDVIKPTHDVAMGRITPDPKKQIEIFYFFSVDCSWCRYMAPDVERLWRLVKNDKNVKMTALTIGAATDEWVEEYRDYTDMSMPIYGGDEIAKKLGMAFVPAVVIIAPNGQKAYVKTGQQNFERLYEFARRVQGLDAVVTAEYQKLASTPIGEAERMHAAQKNGATASATQPALRFRSAESLQKEKDTLSRF